MALTHLHLVRSEPKSCGHPNAITPTYRPETGWVHCCPDCAAKP